MEISIPKTSRAIKNLVTGYIILGVLGIIGIIIGIFAANEQGVNHGTGQLTWGINLLSISSTSLTIMAILGLIFGNILWLLGKEKNKRLVITSIIFVLPFLCWILWALVLSRY